MVVWGPCSKELYAVQPSSNSCPIIRKAHWKTNRRGGKSLLCQFSDSISLSFVFNWCWPELSNLILAVKMIDHRPNVTGICQRAWNQRFLSELLVYLKNSPPRLVLLFLTRVWNPKIYNLEWKKLYDLFHNVSWFQIWSWNSYHTFDILLAFHKQKSPYWVSFIQCYLNYWVFPCGMDI